MYIISRIRAIEKAVYVFSDSRELSFVRFHNVDTTIIDDMQRMISSDYLEAVQGRGVKVRYEILVLNEGDACACVVRGDDSRNAD